ncbi:MAG: protein translocase subunit SecD, partial [Cyclobacteriaceae bacterium]|nr:protein translocase subunit SecD [Cyclobacteriaceae bacterium]
MKNKGFIIGLTILITLLCIYFLSFTLKSRAIQKEAAVYATNAETGQIDNAKKQYYLDSIWNLPVYQLFGAEYTYKEIKDTELNLGLDLQGGMHVVLEISPVDIIKGLSGNNQDPNFLAALGKAREMQKNSQRPFAELFFEAYKELAPGESIAPLFATAANRGKISSTDPDDIVLGVISKEITDAIDRSEIILRTRVDQFGTSQPNIQRLQGTGRIQIEIPGAENPERVRKLLQGVAKLEFWEVVESNTIPALQSINQFLASENRTSTNLGGDDEAETSNVDGLESLESTGMESDSTSQTDSIKALTDSLSDVIDNLSTPGISPLITLASPPGSYMYKVEDTVQIGKILRREEVKRMIPRSIVYMWDNTTNDYIGEPVLTLNWLRVNRGGGPLLSGDVITNARQDFDQYGKPSVSMQMNAEGTQKWRNITREAASKNPQGRVAVVLDGYVYSAPTVQGEIPNGNSQITGNFTAEQVKDLANVLKAGSLPAPTRIVEEAIVGPTLGQIAQDQGIYSMLAGLAIVVLFMVAYYSKGGFVANIALTFNVFFILGILAQYNAALTLPGIAGIVLTIGMSIDANVLIFERIREEMRKGMKLREAIKL